MKMPLQSLTGKRNTSILTPFFGIGLQALSWFILFPIGVAAHEDPVGKSIFTGCSVIWFLIPTAGIFGLCSGVNYVSKNGRDFWAIAGIGLNTLWLILFLFVCYMVFHVGVSA